MTIAQVKEFVIGLLPVTVVTEETTETAFVLPDDIKTLIGREVRYRFMVTSHLTTIGTIKAARVNRKSKRVELLIEPHDFDKLPRVFEPHFVVAYIWKAVR